MCVELPAFIHDSALGRGGTTTDMDHLRLAVHTPRLRRHWTDVADFDLKRCVAPARGQRRMDGAPHRRIEQRRRQASVNDTNRVVMILGGFDGKDCPAFASSVMLKSISIPIGGRGSSPATILRK